MFRRYLYRLHYLKNDTNAAILRLLLLWAKDSQTVHCHALLARPSTTRCLISQPCTQRSPFIRTSTRTIDRRTPPSATHTTEMESDYPGGGRESNSSPRNTQRMHTMGSLSNWSTNQTLTRRYLSSTPRRSHWTQENWGLDLATYQNRANLHVTRQLNVTAASWNKKTSCSSCIEMIPRKRNFSGSRRTLLCLQGTGMEENWKVRSSCLTLGDLASRHTIQTVPTIAFTIYPSTPRSNPIGKGTIQLGG